MTLRTSHPSGGPAAWCRRALGLTAVVAPLLLSACSDSGEGSPTAPPPPPSNAAAASVSGQVTSGNGPGMTVRVQGTDLTTTADAAGAFVLTAVPAGDRVLVFSTASTQAALGLDAVRGGEQIEIQVRVSGTVAQLESIVRRLDGDGDDGADDGTDPAAGLSLELRPDSWNTNWPRSNGTVEAFLRGDGLDAVDLESVELVGDDPEAPVAARIARREGNHVRARFGQAPAFEALADPAPGDVLDVTVRFTLDGEAAELVDRIVIVGPGGDDGGDDDGGDDGDDGGDDGDDGEPPAAPLTVSVQPAAWNTNWPGSNGTVQVFFRGDGFDAIDLGSVELVGDEPEGIAPREARRNGNHVLARFGHADAFGTLVDAVSGEMRTIVLRFTLDGEEMELSDEIRIVGP